MYFKQILILIFGLLTLNSISNNNKAIMLLDSANAAYGKSDFESAIKNYERIISDGFEAKEVYYNLGNAYFKTNKIPYAILNYERALKLSPNDEDAKCNLKLANQRIVDKIDVLPQLFFNEWKDDFTGYFSEMGWSVLLIILFTIALGLMAIYISVKGRAIKKISFWISMVLFVVCIPVFFIAKGQYIAIESKRAAIVITGIANVASSPNENGTKVFILHEGTKVTITQTNADWTEIKLPNGNVGWIKTSDIIFI